MTPAELHKKGMETAEKDFGNGDGGFVGQMFHAKIFITSQEIAILEGIKDWVTSTFPEGENHHQSYNDGRRDLVYDLESFIQKQIEQIKKEK